MNDLDVIVESNYRWLAESMNRVPWDSMTNTWRRVRIVARLTDAICKRSTARKLGGINGPYG